MKVDEWLALFRRHPEKKLFSLADLAQLTGENARSLSVQLTRLTRAQVLKRAAREWYENPFAPPTREEVAMVLRPPAYLSLEYALSAQGILSQTVETLTLVTTSPPYTYAPGDVTYEYHHITPALFWGYTMEGTVAWGEPEKALLDLLYIRYAQTGEATLQDMASLVGDMDIRALDSHLLHRYARRYPPKTRSIISRLHLAPAAL
ncbi:MAG: type IV toxin-antitoxin system AbiEi family antitoxin domain-containing protein [Thermoplasmatota archaeon]